LQPGQKHILGISFTETLEVYRNSRYEEILL
jgi:hypothetical protein